MYLLGVGVCQVLQEYYQPKKLNALVESRHFFIIRIHTKWAENHDKKTR